MKIKVIAWAWAVVLFAVLLATAIRTGALTAITSVWIKNSVMDSTQIGNTTPSTGIFTTVVAGGANGAFLALSTFGAQGSYMSWNQGTGAGASGGTNFVNNHGGGPGGFQWYNTAGPTIGGTLMTLDAGGILNTNGDVYSNTAGPAGSGTFHGALAGTATAATSANTAAALAVSPTNCGANTAPRGINASGAAQNCTAFVTSALVRSVNGATACTPGTSTDASCTGSVSFTAFTDASYMAQLTASSTGGASVGVAITGKTASSVSYVLYCTFNCVSYGSVLVDLWAVHP